MQQRWGHQTWRMTYSIRDCAPNLIASGKAKRKITKHGSRSFPLLCASPVFARAQVYAQDAAIPERLFQEIMEDIEKTLNEQRRKVTELMNVRDPLPHLSPPFAHVAVDQVAGGVRTSRDSGRRCTCHPMLLASSCPALPLTGAPRRSDTDDDAAGMGDGPRERPHQGHGPAEPRHYLHGGLQEAIGIGRGRGSGRGDAVREGRERPWSRTIVPCNCSRQPPLTASRPAPSSSSPPPHAPPAQLLEKAKLKAKAAEKRREKLAERFKEQLKSSAYVTADAAWEDVCTRFPPPTPRLYSPSSA